MTDLCHDCEWMHKDKDLRPRCYSPQLRKFGTPGIIVQFERDGHAEPDRSPENGTGKCGTQKLNYRKQVGV